MVRLPRFVVAAAASGHGKTTVATGLMSALRRSGAEVAGFKVGPDYIDPGYHALATGRPGRNLDAFLCGEDLINPLLLHGAITPRPCDIAVIEGVMGLFDGRLGGEGFASTAHVATLTRSPVVLVADASAATRTVAAVMHGCATFDRSVHVAGVILNKVASPRHSAEVRTALGRTGIPLLGELPRDAAVSVPSRHLGLIPVAEREEARAALDRLAGQIASYVDLDAVRAVAGAAPDPPGEPWAPSAVVSPPAIGSRPDRTAPVVAMAGGRAFTFRYPETEELLRAAGCDPVVVDPLSDSGLPPGCAGLYLGGGFPQVHAAELSANTDFRTAVARAVAAGMPTVAECAGLLYLCRRVDGRAMAAVLDAEADMGPRLAIGYRRATAPGPHLLGEAGTVVHGHEFHRTGTVPAVGPAPAWEWDGVAEGFSDDPACLGRPTVHASYLHTHWAGYPAMAQRFADAIHAFADPRQQRSSLPHPKPMPDQPLAHGGVEGRIGVPLEASDAH